MKILTGFLVFMAFLPEVVAQKMKADWALVYYMPYDNNLSPFADTIEAMIRKGMTNSKVVATFLRDDKTQEGVEHVLINKDTIIRERQTSDYSGNTKTLHRYMYWVDSHVRSNRYAVIFLDHGGSINEVCLDEFPTTKFLAVDSVATVLSAFTEMIGKKLDLLFFQVCSKASIEPIYEVRDVAQYTLASQTELGAPNSYYSGVLPAMSSKTSGEQLAALIAKHERADMYNSLTLIDNGELELFKRRFDRFLDAVAHGETVGTDPSLILPYSYSSILYWDLISFLRSVKTPKKHERLRSEIVNHLRWRVIKFHISNPNSPYTNLKGISLMAPVKKNYTFENLKFTFFENSPLTKVRVSDR